MLALMVACRITKGASHSGLADAGEDVKTPPVQSHWSVEQVEAYLASLNPQQIKGLSDAPSQVIEDVPAALNDQDLAKVMNWIRNKTTGAKLPFCWRQSNTRGVGLIPGRPADCPEGYTNNGATCGRGANTYGAPSVLGRCPDGYTNTGLTCYRGPTVYGKGCTTVFKKYACSAGYTDIGCLCGKGADTLGANTMVCPEGYHQSGITKRCIVNCDEGYTNTGETCFKPLAVLGMGAMTCNPEEQRSGARCYPMDSTCGSAREEDAGLCYSKCRDGFHGVGPVCWQNCDPSWTNCGAGCAKSKLQCGMAVTDQVFSALVIATNIATLGLAAPETAAVSSEARATVTVAGKTLFTETKVGKALVSVLNLMQTIKPVGEVQDVSILRRIYDSRWGIDHSSGIWHKVSLTFIRVNFVRRVGTTLWGAAQDFRKTFAEDFATQTSPEIAATIDKRFPPDVALYIKRAWGAIQLNEMTSANDFEIAANVLSIASIADITGISGIAEAFTKPICQNVIPFPDVAGQQAFGE
jgi:hypothetical protein